MLVEDDEEVTVIVAETPVESSEEQISPAVVTITVAVASTGILSLLVAGIATNESWRIPATSAGLWLLGLVGRTSETSDGRFQRGRLMGYLTVTWLHFTLMAALEMSNGQITHHLKILKMKIDLEKSRWQISKILSIHIKSAPWCSRPGSPYAASIT